MKVYYQISKYNKENELIKKGKKLRSKSFVKAFLVTMYRQFSKLTYGTLDTGNTMRTYTDDAMTYHINACAGNFWTYDGNSNVRRTASTQIGIVVGTGTNAVTTTDYALQTLVADGVAATQLEYGAMYIYPVTVSAPNATLDIERIFRNSSGGTITIKELGIYYKAGTANAGAYYYYCMVRDLSTIAVLSGEYLKITYTFQITA